MSTMDLFDHATVGVHQDGQWDHIGAQHVFQEYFAIKVLGFKDEVQF
ncbi:MAG: hypothetical protein KGJ19_04280 [Betaproteobacteria bacterium]|nr:hypothetical protein [Betaproteobacteria bacterium]